MRRHLAFGALFTISASLLSAQTNAPNWGTSSESLLAISAFAFEPLDSSATYTLGMGGSRYLTAGTTAWYAPLDLPTGTLVTGLELQGCDLTAAGQLTVSLFVLQNNGGTDSATQVGAVLGTGVPEVPNCDDFSIPFPAPIPISNADSTYVVRVLQTGDFTGLLRFAGARVRYRLQVSPAPAVARFNDVPTGHPFFQFVEALSAAGITGGCDVNLYCPDAPITRGQMAVFLSVALGLHFPN